MPFFNASSSETLCSAACFRTSSVIFMLQKGGPPAPASSRFASAGFYLLKIDEGMAGLFFALAQVGEQLVYAVTARGGERIFGAPHFPQHQVAFHFRIDRLGCFIHKV